MSQFIYDNGLVASLENRQKISEVKNVIIHELKNCHADPNLAAYRGRTPLDLAAYWDFYQIIKVLVNFQEKNPSSFILVPGNPYGDFGFFFFFFF